MAISGMAGYRRVIQVLAFASTAIGILVMVGWIFSIRLILNIPPGQNPMKFNTAICFVLLGLALYIRSYTKSVFYHRVSAAFGLAVAIFAISNLVMKFVWHSDALDLFLIEDSITPEKYAPGRMSPITLVCVAILGFGLAASNSTSRMLLRFSQDLFNGVSAVTYIVFIGYFMQVPELYTLNLFNPVALSTAICLLFIATGASLLNPFLGVTAMFTNTGTAGIIARRLTVQFIAMVLLSAGLRLLAHRCHAFSAELGIALFAVLFSFIGLFLIWKTYRALGRIEEKNRIAEERFRTVVELAPNGLIISDTAGNIRMANREAVKIFGYEQEELLAGNIDMLVPAQFRSSHAGLRKSYHRRPVEHTMGAGRNMFALTKSGQELPVEITLKPIVTDEGKMILASIVDISERIKAESTMRAQMIELSTRYQELEQFNYLASHDLKEPLRTVSNYIRIIEEDYPGQVNDDIKGYHSAMNQAVVRMNTLVHLLLDYARLGYRKKLSRVDTAVVVHEVIADLNDLITKSGAVITIRELPVLEVYETEFRLLMQNLINNAVKFRRPEVVPMVEIGASGDGAPFEFYVRDNGIGIPAKHFGKIFKIFQRLHKDSEYAGHGIGLTSCRKIVEMHGGRIWLESAAGEGTTVRFTIAQLNTVSR